MSKPILFTGSGVALVTPMHPDGSINYGKIEELVEKIKGDKDLMTKFQKDPISTVEGVLGIDLPNDQVQKIVDGIKAKISLDSIGDKLGGLFGKK